MEMVLPDVLTTGLKVVFCGTAVGERSAKRGCYYNGPGNSFWPTLKKVGMIPATFTPQEFLELPKYGIGLTDLVKHRSASDRMLQTVEFDVSSLHAKILKFAPRVIAFNGKRAAEVFLGHVVTYGRQREKIGDTTVFVLPSTSGAARSHWDEDEWMLLARFLAKAV